MMFKSTFKFILVTVLLTAVSVVNAKPIYKKDAEEIRRVLQSSGVSEKQSDLLVRRMAARKISSEMAKRWTQTILKMHEERLPVQVAVDRLHQGLIKNIKPAYIDKALKVLLSNLAWSNELVVKKTLPDEPDVKNLDSDDQALLTSATTNLEIAARQGFTRNEISIALSRKGVDLEMAAELAKAMTLWSNYGVDKKRVLLSIKRATRIKLDADKVKDVRESVDSKVVSEKLDNPSKIGKVI